MNGQQSLLSEPVPVVPSPLVDFLAGIAARYAFGESPTQAQRREAHRAAIRMAAELAQLKAVGG